MGASVIALCKTCRREVLPAFKGPSWGKHAHRAAAKGMARPIDAKAEQKKAAKARKEEKKKLRHAVRTDGIAAAAVIYINTRNASFAPISYECDKCKRTQDQLRAERARFLGYDPTTNTAYAQLIA